MLFKKNNLIAIFLIVSSSVSFAQSKSEKRQIKKYLKEGQIHFYIEDYYSAWKQYLKALRIDKKEDVAGVNAAICAFKLKYPVDSIAFLVENLSSSKQPDAEYYLARIKHQQKKFDEAIDLLNSYSRIDPKERTVEDNEVEYMIGVCKNAKALFAAPHRSVIKNMGPAVNSPFADYVPVIVPDESALYFTSRRPGSSDNRKDGDGIYYEDVYVSHRQDNKWQPAQNIGNPVNSGSNDACVALSPDGQRMIIYRTSVDRLSGDLYITHLGKDNKWGALQKIGNEVNSQYIETSACFSNDSSEIYFSSNRPGGYGGKDIYRIKKAPNGAWAVPYNLGPGVNTPYDEDAPYLHPDGVTLYFSSQGHNTMGEYDVFKSVANPENNHFGKAENLGYPINDVGNDIFFVLNVNGQTGYYSSSKPETTGGIDIYEIDTRFGDNDLKVKHGTVLLNNQPGRVKITLTDTETNQLSGNYYSNPGTGKFILVMNPLKSYKALVESDGYEPQVIDLAPIATEKTDNDLEFRLKK